MKSKEKIKILTTRTVSQYQALSFSTDRYIVPQDEIDLLEWDNQSPVQWRESSTLFGGNSGTTLSKIFQILLHEYCLLEQDRYDDDFEGTDSTSATL